MTFDSDRAVGAICDAAEALIKMRRVRVRVKIDVHSNCVDVSCKPTLRVATEEAKSAFDTLVDVVSYDGIGYGEGGLYELLARGVRQVSICEHSFLTSITPQYRHIQWCADASPMLRLLSHETEHATTELLKGRGDTNEQSVQARFRIRRESARVAFHHLQRQGNERLGDWFMEGQSISEVPEIVRSCERLWLVFNISNDFNSDILRQTLR